MMSQSSTHRTSKRLRNLKPEFDFTLIKTTTGNAEFLELHCIRVKSNTTPHAHVRNIMRRYEAATSNLVHTSDRQFTEVQKKFTSSTDNIKIHPETVNFLHEKDTEFVDKFVNNHYFKIF